MNLPAFCASTRRSGSTIAISLTIKSSRYGSQEPCTTKRSNAHGITSTAKRKKSELTYLRPSGTLVQLAGGLLLRWRNTHAAPTSGLSAQCERSRGSRRKVVAGKRNLRYYAGEGDYRGHSDSHRLKRLELSRSYAGVAH